MTSQRQSINDVERLISVVDMTWKAEGNDDNGSTRCTPVSLCVSVCLSVCLPVSVCLYVHVTGQ